MVRLRPAIPILVLTAFATAGSGLPGQTFAGSPENVLLQTSNNLVPAGQTPVVDPGGRYVAVTGIDSTGDLAIVRIGEDGTPGSTVNVVFPSGNGVSAVNPTLVPSEDGCFMAVLGSSGTGELVIIRPTLACDPTSPWEAVNVNLPGTNDVPATGTRPAISPDGRYVAVIGSGTYADVFIVPIDSTSGVAAPMPPVSVNLPSGNNVPLVPSVPVIRHDGAAIVVPGSTTTGDLGIITVPFWAGAPPASTTLASTITATNVSYPGSNSIPDPSVPPVMAGSGAHVVTHGSPTIGDLVVTPLDAAGYPLAPQNVLFPGSANASTQGVAPSMSVAGGLIAVQGAASTSDLILLPVDPITGTAGSALVVAYPSSNNVAAGAAPPAVAPDGSFVVTSGSSTIGDIVVTRVSYATSTSISAVAQNVLYPNSNNLPVTAAPAAIASDASFVATLGQATIGDLVITPVDPSGVPQAPANVLYPQNVNVNDLTDAPVIAESSAFVVTAGNGSTTDVVLTPIERDASCDAVPGNVELIAFASNNNLASSTADVLASRTGQFLAAPGSATIGDLVVVPVVREIPHILGIPRIGRTVDVRFRSPGNGGRCYIAAAAFCECPGFTVLGSAIPLCPDVLFAASFPDTTGLFPGFIGFLDPFGVATGAVIIPAVPALRGYVIYLAFLVGNAACSGIAEVSEACALRFL